MRRPARDTSFGLLRLVLAASVIVSHGPELADNATYREPLTMVFGTISLGELAVDGFFIASGWLVTASFLATASPATFLARRIARIYPAFLVAYFSVGLLVGWLSGAQLPRTGDAVTQFMLRAALLQPPELPGAFAGNAAFGLDGAMWTIAYEFRCYLLALLIGTLGLYGRRRLMLGLAAMLMALTVIGSDFLFDWDSLTEQGRVLHGDANQIRFTALFLTGACFLLWRDEAGFDPRWAGVMAIGLAASLAHRQTATPGIALFGGWLLFTAARAAARSRLASIGERNDISYGTYLYAYPITQLLLMQWPTMPLILLDAATLMAACFLGWVSWTVIERPVLARIRADAGAKQGDRVLVTG